MSTLHLDNVAFTPAPQYLQRTGLLGWVTATLNGHLGLDGLAVRRTADGSRTLTFPTRIDGRGREHALVWPLDDGTRREIESVVFKALEVGS